jgi:putative transposase
MLIIRENEMTITHKFRLYPSRKIEEKLLFSLDVCRQAYNFALGELNSQKVIDKNLIQATIPDLHVCQPYFKDVYQKTLQYEVHKLFSNLRGLAEMKKKGIKVGALRFKGKGYFKTFTYNQLGFELITTGKRCQVLNLSKIGDVPIRCHRKILGEVKQVTIKHFPSGKWYAFIVEDGKKNIEKKLSMDRIVGIDLGVDNLIHDSDNHVIEAPRFYRKKERRLKHLQRIISRKVKGSNNRIKFRRPLSVQHESVANCRDDFAHKVSRYYNDNYDVIGYEDFDIRNMVHGKYGKGILDAGWGIIRKYTYYKAVSAGNMYVTVEYRGTTIDCSQCGEKVPKEIWQRWHKCPECGFSVPRDYNSALEVKNRVIIKIRQELPEFTKHLEMEALPIMATSVCEE